MRRNIVAEVLACVLVAQCAPAPSSAPPPTPLASMSDIAGQWDIVSFDGYHPRRLDSDGGRHAFVDISGDGVAFAIECNYSGITAARIENGRLVRVAGDDMQTEMGCGPEREQRDREFFTFLRNGPTIQRRGGDELVLERDGVTLELQRAEVRQRQNSVRLLTELNGEWTTPIIYQQMAPGETRNVLAFGTPGTASFSFTDGAIRMTFDCETAVAQVQMSAPGTLAISTPQRTTAGPCTLSQQDRDAAASLITGAITAEHIQPNVVHLAAGDVRAVLTRS